METTLLAWFALLFSLGGSFITWRYGAMKYGEGVKVGTIEALIDHHKGTLEYKVHKETDDEFKIEIIRIESAE